MLVGPAGPATGAVLRVAGAACGAVGASRSWDRTAVHATRTSVSARPIRTLGLARLRGCGGVRVTGGSGGTDMRSGSTDTRHHGDEVGAVGPTLGGGAGA